MIINLKYFLLPILILIGTPLVSNALLVDISNSSGHVVYDTVGERYWYYGLKDFTNMTWTEQKSAVAGLASVTYFGLSGWHIASSDEMQELWMNEVSNLVYAFQATSHEYTGQHSWEAYYARYDSVRAPFQHYIASCGVMVSGDPTDPRNYTFTSTMEWGIVVADEDLWRWEGLSVFATSSVPDASIILLLGSSLMGLAVFSRKSKKS